MYISMNIQFPVLLNINNLAATIGIKIHTNKFDVKYHRFLTFSWEQIEKKRQTWI